MKASNLFVKALENEGVEYIFGIPGEENLDLLDSLKHSGIRFILTRHEQGAGFMAATYGRLTGKVGVCLSTLGPGATNLVTPAAYANLGGMPMLLITGQKPIKKSKQGRFQIIHTVQMMRPLTKYTKTIQNGNSIPSMIRESFKLAQEERPGATHLELPEDIAREECDADVFEVQRVRYPVASKESISSAIEMLQSAKQPLILIGAGANRTRIGTSLNEFIDKSGIPFFSTQMGKGVVNEFHPLYLGTAALSENDYLHCAIERADLIINIGHDVIEKPPFFMKKGGTKVIHINFASSQVDATYFPQMDLVGDIASTIIALKENLTVPASWNFEYYKRVIEETQSHITKYFKDDRFPILPQRAVKCIRDLMPNDAILTLDNGIYKIWFARNYKCYEPNTLLLDNALATMGAGLPSAIAAKLVHPEKKVLAVCGDGGFMMNSQELETAVRLGLDLVIIVLNDSAFGMIKWKQEGLGFENFGLDFKNPDFITYAKSYGAMGYRPSSTEEFIEILGKVLNSKGVHLIDLAVDYSLNHAILTELLKNKTCLT
ncbi:MAG TPA: acetolactate synthase large subunit [Sulfurovum sp.]|nr:acetolactate synthase large subunit [Sulfurovum sp.]